MWCQTTCAALLLTEFPQLKPVKVVAIAATINDRRAGDPQIRSLLRRGFTIGGLAIVWKVKSRVTTSRSRSRSCVNCVRNWKKF